MRLLFILCCFVSTFSLSAQTIEVYISDAGDFSDPPWQILKVDENGENAEVFIDEQLAWPQDIVFLEDRGIVLISNLNSGRINRHDITTGAYLSTFASGISGPTRMKIGADSILYVLQWSGNGRVKRYQLDGTALEDFTDVGVSNSIGLDWDKDGNLYVSSYNRDHVRKYDTAGADLGLFIEDNLTGPTNIWFNDDGDLLVADYDGNAVRRFGADGAFKGNFMIGLSQHEGVDFMPNGDILIGNGATSSVKRYHSDGIYKDEFVESGTANLMRPNAVVIREVTTSSISEAVIETEPILYPTVGRQFYLRDVENGVVTRIQVFTSDGREVHATNGRTTLVWSADHYPTGTYLIKVHFNDGRSFSERVVVQD